VDKYAQFAGDPKQAVKILRLVALPAIAMDFTRVREHAEKAGKNR